MSSVSMETAPVASDFDVVARAEYVPPRANLLPPEIAEQARLRRFQLALAAAVILCAAVVALLYVTTTSGRGPANAALADAQVQRDSLAAQQQSLAASQAAHTKVAAAKQSLTAATGSEVLWSLQLNALREALPADVRLSALTVTPAAASSGAAPAAVTLPVSPAGSSPAAAGTSATATSASVATVALTGVALDNNAVAGLLDRLARLPGWADVYLTSTSAGAGSSTVSYSITANITKKALSHRYTDGS